MKIKITDIILLILMINILNCQSQSDKSTDESSEKDQIKTECKTFGENNRVRKFEDCNKYSNLNKSVICCYVTGINPDQSDYDGCIGISYVFANKSLSYESKSFSGKLICKENYSSQNIIKFPFFIYIFSFIFQCL